MKLTNSRIILSFAILLVLIPASAKAQAIFAARESFRLQAGFGAMYLNNDYSDRAAQGVAFWADADFGHFRGIIIGAEAEAHLGTIITPDDIGETSYLVGPRLSYQRRKLTVYGKLLVGKATITNQLFHLSSSYNVAPAFGGGIEYHVGHKWNVRAFDVEVQQWPNFEPHTLSPLSVTVGVSYSIFPRSR
jgi:Outer membrane protein beta-barrel domain